MKMLLKSGSVEALANYRGVDGEMIINVESSDLRVMDGIKEGGHSVTNINFTAGAIEVSSPPLNSFNVSTQPIIQMSEYVGIGMHIASYWQIATDETFSTLIYTSGRDTINLNSLDLCQLDITLDFNTRYYFRTKYESNYGVITDWSEPSNFTTKTISLDGIQTFKMIASDFAAPAQFGWDSHISSDGNYVVIAAPFENTEGSIYVFVKSGLSWVQQAKLKPIGIAADDQFGNCARINSNGTYIIVGANMDDDKGINSGSAYIFSRSGSNWTQQAKLTASDGGAYDQFGHSVDISNDGSIAVISAHGDDDRGTNAGAAYVFTRSGTTWTQRAKLKASDGVANDWFSISVAISGDGSTIAIGSSNSDPNGSVYIFTGSGATWTQRSKLLFDSGNIDDDYGRFVDLSDDGKTIAIAAISDDTDGVNSGSVHIYRYLVSSWIKLTRIVPSDVQPGDFFGFSVSLSADGNTVLSGAPGKNTNKGSAYVFVYTDNAWIQLLTLSGDDCIANDRFGTSCTISALGSTAIIGARTQQASIGSAYVFI